MGQHLLYLPDLPESPTGSVVVGGEEAHHALRVRRLATGDEVRICNGRGTIVRGEIRVTRRQPRSGEWEFELGVTEVRQVPPPRPRVDVFASAPKGDRLGEMIDGLSQVGAASWRPLLTAHTIVDPREGKIDRQRRIAIESLKQCGRAHVLDIGAAVDMAAALAAPGVVLADASGEPYDDRGGETVTLLIGPEGGWSPEELAKARGSGARIARFGCHTMRIETAAVVAAGIIMAKATE